MNHTNLHNDNNLSEKDFFASIEPIFEKSKDDVWKDIISEIDVKQETDSVSNNKNSLSIRFYYSIAASLILILGTTLFLRYYTTTIYCPVDNQFTHILPDGSTVKLQPGSELTYYPLWWNFSRKVALTGEAFFSVKKGGKFKVTSQLGSTTVLGTSFNIYASNDEYIVSCFTGKVKVVSLNLESVILNPDYSAEITVNGFIKVSKYKNAGVLLNHGDNMFDYSSVPLSTVIREIEDHYNIKVTSEIELVYDYTGFFSKEKSIEDVLYLICKPYGLTFVKLSDNTYHIIKY